MKNNNDPQHELARAVALTLISRAWKIALAESCTGGLVCATLTDLAGSSDWLERGYITYSNAAKSECLDVPVETIESFGAVSEEVAKAMAEGALRNANVNAAISITGIAGPTGGSPEKPVGTVWVAVGSHASIITKQFHFRFDRQKNIQLTAMNALNLLRELLVKQADK